MLLKIDFEELRLDKVVIELRHKDVFSFPENKYKILEKLTGKFPTYNMDFPDQLILTNIEKQQNINITLNRFVLSWDVPRSYDDFTKFSDSIIKEVYKIIKVEKFSRVGIRTFWTKDVNLEKEANDYISNRFFSAGARNTNNIADEVYGQAIKFSGRKESLFFNLSVAHQREQTFENNRSELKVIDQKESILFDLDIYRDSGIGAASLSNFIQSTNQFISNSFKNYLKDVEK